MIYLSLKYFLFFIAITNFWLTPSPFYSIYLLIPFPFPLPVSPSSIKSLRLWFVKNLIYNIVEILAFLLFVVKKRIIEVKNYSITSVWVFYYFFFFSLW